MPFGTYRGLRFGVVINAFSGRDVYLEGQITRHYTLSREHHGPRAVLNALERLATGYGIDCERSQQDLEVMEKQLADYQVRLGRPFEHEGYLVELAALRDRLKIGLSAPQEGDKGPTVAELAGKIKALKARHAAEPAAERTAPREVKAEEPVTVRILRKAEEAEAGHVERLAKEPRAANGRG